MKNVFYQYYIYEIGGVETFLFELAKLAYRNNRDLTILYKYGDPKQIQRLKRYCKVLNINNVEKPIICERAFFNYVVDEIDNFDAKEYIQLIHADFKDKSLADYVVPNNPKITQFISVSENNAKSYFERSGNESKVVYNPIHLEDEDTKEIITLISAQRLSPEKGGNRIVKLIKALDNANIPYVYHIFSNDKLPIENENIIYHKPTLNIRKWIKYADYMVLLSDTEGYSYGALESLCLGTPLIITNLPILSELGANESNSIILDFDMKNLDVNEIYENKGKFKFKYEEKSKNSWLTLLKGKTTYKPYNVEIVATKNYTDMELGRDIRIGETYEVLDYRADEIIAKGFAKLKEN